MKRQINTLLFAFLIAFKVIGQIDTIIEQSNLYETELDCSRKKCKYFVNKKPATKVEYENANAAMHVIEKCTPCWLKYKNQTGQLVYEGDFYTDCCIGAYIEWYDNGKLKLKGQYKIPATKIPDYNKGDCRRDGNWVYYKINGEIEKTEVYKEGIIIKQP